ncbi:MAG: DALR domain-containing protein, partial [Burkholderiales bacterium]
DLVFPHHENEIAKSEGASGRTFVRCWMHNGFVTIDEEKMSKSLGNFRTLRDILASFDPEVVRFFIVRAHYRSPLNYSDAHLQDAKAALTRLYTALRDSPAALAPVDWNEPHGVRFKAAMDNDFGTPEAIAVLFDLANAVNRGAVALAPQLRALGGALGLLQRDARDFLRAGPGAGLDAAEIERRIALRAAFKREKNYAAADAERSALAAAGIILEDGAAGTTWRRG